jgi:catechol 2,3-dioxygenase-like lactoylglutathione lyase family enzyme
VESIEAIIETAVYVEDLDQAETFYRDVLGLQSIGKDPGRHAFLRIGNSVLLLFVATTTLRGDILPAHGAKGPGHFAFGVRAEDLEDWKARLQRCGVAIEQEVVWPKGPKSVYFRDPSGNLVELITPGLWGLPNGW